MNSSEHDYSVPDSMVSAQIEMYMQLRTGFGGLITEVECAAQDAIEDPYSDEPTYGPTSDPTSAPTDRDVDYDDIYIPVQVIDYYKVYAAFDSWDYIGFLCETSAPTSAPSAASTTSTPHDSSSDAETFAVFTYVDSDESTNVSAGILFPNLGETNFESAYETVCGFSSDDWDDDDDYYYVTVETIYTEFQSVCIQLNDDSSTIFYDWTFTSGMFSSGFCME